MWWLPRCRLFDATPPLYVGTRDVGSCRFSFGTSTIIHRRSIRVLKSYTHTPTHAADTTFQKRRPVNPRLFYVRVFLTCFQVYLQERVHACWVRSIELSVYIKTKIFKKNYNGLWSRLERPRRTAVVKILLPWPRDYRARWMCKVWVRRRRRKKKWK